MAWVASPWKRAAIQAYNGPIRWLSLGAALFEAHTSGLCDGDTQPRQIERCGLALARWAPLKLEPSVSATNPKVDRKFKSPPLHQRGTANRCSLLAGAKMAPTLPRSLRRSRSGVHVGRETPNSAQRRESVFMRWSLICPGFGTTRAHQPVNASESCACSSKMSPWSGTDKFTSTSAGKAVPPLHWTIRFRSVHRICAAPRQPSWRW